MSEVTLNPLECALSEAQALRRQVDALKAENAKLRELVKSMYYDLSRQTFPPDWMSDYKADMREMGVDV